MEERERFSVTVFFRKTSAILRAPWSPISLLSRFSEVSVYLEHEDEYERNGKKVEIILCH